MAANIMRFLTWKLVLRVFIAGVILGLICLIALFMWFSALARNVPSIDQLAEYEPAITSRVHAGDGALIAEFAQEHRVFVPYESIPTHLIEAFVSAEDKSFFEHNGLDYRGITRGALITLRNKIMGSGGMQGGSTITQQVAKNMVLTSDQNFTRKAREAIIARRMESAFTKGEIMELYLNEIYLGRRSYGVGSAALNYFNKSLPELDLAQAATLAALAQLPGRVNPDTNPERLTRRRNWVLGRMVINGYITNEAADEAKSLPLETTRRLRGPEYAAATYFVQELRKELISSYGEDELETGGLSIRSTIDTGLQLAAQEALQTGLETYDRRHEYRGPFAHIELGPEAINELAELKLPGGSGTWEAGLIARVSETGAILRLKDGAEISMPAEDVAWAAETYATADHAGLQLGDVVLAEFSRQTLKAEETVAPTAEGAEFDDDGNNEAVLAAEPLSVPIGEATLRQVPEIDGAVVAIDPHTGRILAMAGGYSFWKSQFNRVTQAERQPGSSFKPFVYMAALEKGYTPATMILDSPFVDFDVSTNEYWAPRNYSRERSYGEVTMRRALEKSYNQVTARVSKDIGMESVSDLSERFRVYDDLPPYNAMSLGAGETTLLRLATGYASIVNGGRAVTPTLLDRVQDRYGETMFRHDERECLECTAESWNGQLPPELADTREQVVDPVIAYQMVHMLEGVVQTGTGRRALRVGKPLAGKTGTTNDYKDAWFMGFSPDLVVGVWVGFDEPHSMGDGEAGGSVAAPIFTDFMEAALADQAALPFRIPPGVRLVSIDADRGQLPSGATSRVIVEAFQPGTEPGLSFVDETDFSISGSGDSGIFGRTPVTEPGGETGEDGEGTLPVEDVSDDGLGDTY